MTTLSQYLQASGTTQRAFAALVSVSPSYINEIAKGTKSPGLRLALRIQDATDGAVPVSTLVNAQ